MKKLIVISSVLLSIMFSPPSYSKWKYYGTNDKEDKFYVDIDKVRKHSGYVYFLGIDRLQKTRGKYWEFIPENVL